MSTSASLSTRASHGAMPAPSAGRLVEVWGDTVDIAHLGKSIVIGAVISLSGYFLASRVLLAMVAAPEMARAYAMLVGLAGCLTAGIAAVAQQREIQLRSVSATLEGEMDVLGILGADPDVRNGFSGIAVSYDIDADASREEIEGIVAQSQKRSAVFDVITNPTNVRVTVV